jgi:hypothetical protein
MLLSSVISSPERKGVVSKFYSFPCIFWEEFLYSEASGFVSFLFLKPGFRTDSFFPHLLVFFLVFLAGGCLILFFVRNNKVMAGFLAAVLVWWLLIWGGLSCPAGHKPFKISQTSMPDILRHLPEDKEIVAYGLKQLELGPFNFYTGIHKIRELKRRRN